MLHTNYPNLLKMIITRNKGFWRIEAIGRLSKKINQGQSQLEYLKNLITRHEKQNQAHSFLQINSVKSFNKKLNTIEKSRSKSSQTFFVTQIPNRNLKRHHKYNDQLFMNEYEENMYNHIELHPFEIKYMRHRDENQKYFNVQEIKKEIEKNYNYIRNEQIKNRPFSSYYKNRMNNNDLFGYEINKNNNSNNININKYYSNNLNMNKKRKNGYKIKFNNSNHINKTINENWKNSKQKKRIISAYLNNRMKGDFFGEENELFEKIKKNKKNRILFNNFTTKNKKIDNFSTITNISNNRLQNKENKELFDKLISFGDINKNEINKRIFNSINNEENKNFFNDIKFKNSSRKNKSAKINKNLILSHVKNDYNKNHFNSNKYNSLIFKNEINDAYIDKKSKVIKIK